ncbi:MAG: acyloxyacyl hydrolase [Micavibrio aeruginosavorus]|uniref:Acyloxyacyl hydrolase n=1 Tax=Micavibrio aeruginosavorus TaxID=349221 RepID=A0A2W5MU43_9BACT|nr:MAG: acyloxyacyl hydrolase [Micavibrio aeruginosavorus]
MKKLAILAALGGLLFASNPAKAQDSTDPAYLSLGVGYYDILDSSDGGAADFRVEYRSGNEFLWKLKPWMGFEANNDGSVWAGGGVLADFMLAQNIYLTPSFGAGLYAQGSSDKDLGSPIEFRTQLEAGYEFDNQSRVGVAFGHISNASIGDDNPGTEILNVYYHIPIASLF